MRLTDEILKIIDAELARLQQARDVLAAATTPAPRRQLSPQARKAIGDAQRKRWADARSKKEAPAG